MAGRVTPGAGRRGARILGVLSGVVLGLTLAVWAWSLLVWPVANGVALGVRRYHEHYDFVCGVRGRNGEIWYYETIVPTSGDIFRDAQRLGSHGNRGLLGFQLIGYFPNRVDWYCGFSLPFWAWAGGSGWILLRARRRLRRLREAERGNVCANCGYDLRATPERCPECGLAVAKRA